MKDIVSKSTRRNWERLKTKENSRLTKRANKRLSLREIVPVEYFTNKDNRPAVSGILHCGQTAGASITDILCSTAENLFREKGISGDPNVKKVLSGYPYRRIESIINSKLPQDEKDILGLLYQSSLPEGIKNQKGSYYTPHQTAVSMTSQLRFDKGQTFLDPCCGSGAFLLSLACDDPTLLYGVDNDPIAVMIAKFNLLLRYPDRDFLPNIICGNFLQDFPWQERTFDYIVTNPPWGAAAEKKNCGGISSGETFSLFFAKACQYLKAEGIIRFLLPESVLNVKIHKDIRRFILENCCLNSITKYNRIFSGVSTNFADIECQKKAPCDTVLINDGRSSFYVRTETFSNNENNVFCFLTPQDAGIVQQCRDAGKYTLAESIWALGIVTGDNKKLLKSAPEAGLEAIYTGKEVAPYVLAPPKNYIRYDRDLLQQTAKEEYYRAPEKLVYKFISKKLVFACDDKQCLVLNSANILIPHIPGMSIKTVMALLNSELFSFLYQKMFGEVKILKGNLMQLPFPEISPETDRKLSALTSHILSGDRKAEELLQKEIYALFGLSAPQAEYIKNILSGKTAGLFRNG